MSTFQGVRPAERPSSTKRFAPCLSLRTRARKPPSAPTSTAAGSPPARRSVTRLDAGSTRPVKAKEERLVVAVAGARWPAVVPASGAAAAGRSRSTVPVTAVTRAASGSGFSPQPASRAATAASSATRRSHQTRSSVSGPTSASEPQPASAIVRSSSARRLSSTSATPASPATARP